MEQETYLQREEKNMYKFLFSIIPCGENMYSV